MASHFQAHSDSQLGPALARLILQMQYVEKRQTGIEGGQRRWKKKKRGKGIDRKRGEQLKGKQEKDYRLDCNYCV